MTYKLGSGRIIFQASVAAIVIVLFSVALWLAFPPHWYMTMSGLLCMVSATWNVFLVPYAVDLDERTLSIRYILRRRSLRVEDIALVNIEWWGIRIRTLAGRVYRLRRFALLRDFLERLKMLRPSLPIGGEWHLVQ